MDEWFAERFAEEVRQHVEAIDSALHILGEGSLGQCPHFRDVTQTGAAPGFPRAYRLEKPGAAPLLFLLGPEFRIDVGDLEEWHAANANDQNLVEDTLDALTSLFVIEDRRWSTRLVVTDRHGRSSKATWWRKRQWPEPARFGPAFRLATEEPWPEDP